MNGFRLIFEDRMKAFWEEMPENEMQSLFNDILVYANANPESFKAELAEFQFDVNLQPLPIILEALSRNTDRWGQFYVDLLDTILAKTKTAKDPQAMIDHLIEYCLVEYHPKLFVKHIAARLHKELLADNLYTKCAAISMLPNYLENPVVEDKEEILAEIKRKLKNPKWQVRYIAYISLKNTKRLPPNYKLSFKDKLLRLYYGPQLTF